MIVRKTEFTSQHPNRSLDQTNSDQPSVRSAVPSSSSSDTANSASAAKSTPNMVAAMLSRYGDATEFEVAEVDRPAVRPDRVLIRVRAAGLNPIDYRIRQGQLRLILPAKFPMILGYDVAGEIAEVGKDVERAWTSGDRVYAFLNNRHGGGYAQFVEAHPDVIARKPVGLTMEAAAAIPLAATTALQALRDVARIRIGQQVLINGASGGVGHFAVQLAKGFQARVTGVCGGSNLDFVRDLGADDVIDYERQDFTRSAASYDIIFDAVAKSSYWQCRRILAPGGIYITTVPSAATLAFHCFTQFGRKCRFVLAKPSGEDLDLIREAVEKGILKPSVQQTFSLDEIADAHELLETHHVRGKITLSIPP